MFAFYCFLSVLFKMRMKASSQVPIVNLGFNHAHFTRDIMNTEDLTFRCLALSFSSLNYFGLNSHRGDLVTVEEHNVEHVSPFRLPVVVVVVFVLQCVTVSRVVHLQQQHCGLQREESDGNPHQPP